MKSLNNYIKESLLDMDEDSPELQQAILLEKILEYYKDYSLGNRSVSSNHRYTSIYLENIVDQKRYNSLINNFDLFLKQSNIHHKKITNSNEVSYIFDIELTISFMYLIYDKSDFVCRCILHTSQNGGLKNFDKKL
jgi:hypothetical protein